MKRLPVAAMLLMGVTVLPLGVAVAPGVAQAASQIKVVVNNVAVTNFDIQRRVAFLKLQRKAGGETVARDEMVEQALKSSEMDKLGIRVAEKQVDDAFARFASGNKLSPKQMAEILGQAGVTAEHFKQFIRVQIGWNQALAQRYRAKGQVTEQDAVQRMLKQGGAKPTATEYVLQQVIFVVPAAERAATLAKRKREADAMRARFSSCESTRQFVKGLIDVSVRDLGRVLTPELPPDWADMIKVTNVGAATPVRETPRGVEFIGICTTREVSDDRVARMVFQNEGSDAEKADEISKTYLTELREKARIVER